MCSARWTRNNPSSNCSSAEWGAWVWEQREGQDMGTATGGWRPNLEGGLREARALRPVHDVAHAGACAQGVGFSAWRFGGLLCRGAGPGVPLLARLQAGNVMAA